MELNGLKAREPHMRRLAAVRLVCGRASLYLSAFVKKD